jgi:uncharacterized membrane protein
MHAAKDLLSILGNVGSLVAAVIAICGLWMARAARKRGKDNS